MKEIKFSYEAASPFVKEHELEFMQPLVSAAHKMLREKTGQGSDFLGWLDWPSEYDKEEFNRIKQAADKIKDQAEVLVVIGIGGSYLGAKAAISFLADNFYDAKRGEENHPHVVFAGNNISGSYLNDLLSYLDGRDFALNVISKSGTTTEPAIAFRVLKEVLIKRYGEDEANNRIYVTTDKEKGALRAEANVKGYETFIIPDSIGGRFTVLTPVGLLPIAVAGFDIDAIMEGARHSMERFTSESIEDNEAYQYAALRNIFNRKGYSMEILVNYEPSLTQIAEWWKQLFGESEGKDNKGIYPASVSFSADLHSMGQYMQEGSRRFFETVMMVEEPAKDITIPTDESNLDGLNYLEGKTVNDVNQKAYEGTLLAHTDGRAPNLLITLPNQKEETLGQLIYFFEVAVAISGYLNGVNPFDQPGVEAYKNNMFALLGKPGYEELGKELNKRL